MALKDRLDSAPPRLHGLPCSVGQLRAALPADEQAALDRMLYDLGWSASQIYTVLVQEGYDVGRQTIGRHRRGECRCLVEQ